MRTLIHDLRYGTRMLAKRPGFTFIAVLTLALGIGANTAILSTVNAFLLRPLPVAHPEELVQPFHGSHKDLEVWNNFSYPNYIDLRDQNQVFSGLLARRMLSAGISDSANRQENVGAGSEIIWGEAVSGNFFDVLGVNAVLGRTFLPEEHRTPDTHAVAVIGNLLWQRRFNSDPSIIGKTIYLNSHPFTVVGVASETFGGAEFAVRQDFWIPLMMQGRLGLYEGWVTGRGWRSFRLLGRLKPGITMRHAEANLNSIAENLVRLYPDTNGDTKIQVVGERDGRFNEITGLFKFTSLIALAVTGLVLLVACANVANLLLARAGARSREIGIRLAIGASRFQIVRQLLVESVLLAVLGGGLGLLFAFWGTDLIRASIPPLPVPLSLDFTPDMLVLKWMLVVTLVTGVIFGLAPALIGSRTNLVSVLKSDAAGQLHHGRSRRWNLRNLLVVAQIAISIIVLVCAGLFLRSLNRLKSADPGYTTENLITMGVAPGPFGYSMPEGKRFFSELLRRVEAQPGVRSASLALFIPLANGNDSRGPIVKEGEPEPPPNQSLTFEANVIAPNYFETMKTTLVLGRDFSERDNDDSPRVAIVNQEFARRLYGSEENAMGKRFHEWGPSTPALEIVGVAKDGLYIHLFESPRPYFFVPEFQADYQSEMTLLVSANSSSDIGAVVDGVRREIAKMDSRVPVVNLQIGEQNLAWALWGPRLAAGLASSFGVLALLLAAMGLYSVMNYAVSRRTRELGIRMAIGAQARDMLRLVIGEGMLLVITGTGIGLLGAFSMTGFLSSLLFGISATNLPTFLGVAVILLVVSLLACYIPARRATKVDPMIALRYE